MIDYIFRNKHGMEIKRTVPKLLTEAKAKAMIGIKRGYKLHQVVNYGVTDKDLKAR